MSDRKPTSSWQRHGKTSFVYSPAYQLWHAEAKKNGAGSPRALTLACQHAKQMHVVNEACVSA